VGERAGQNGEYAVVKAIGKMNNTRVPIFVVLDEAHNFVPTELRNRAEKALKDQFCTIAAEGRKYLYSLF
jgi:DNA helicase HerA-like ATPase